tara:strand:+ start:123 stop:326 length:204 start_codon:yes stop_codon:yes gene_type:complete
MSYRKFGLNNYELIMYPFFVIGAISVIAIFLGLFARDTLGPDFSNILFFGGVIVGCINVLVGAVLRR